MQTNRERRESWHAIRAANWVVLGALAIGTFGWSITLGAIWLGLGLAMLAHFHVVDALAELRDDVVKLSRALERAHEFQSVDPWKNRVLAELKDTRAGFSTLPLDDLQKEVARIHSRLERFETDSRRIRQALSLT